MNEDFRLYGIFGFPLGHTLSPAMQERAARALGLKAFYLPFEVGRKDFLRLMQRLPDLVLDGFNVTVPYKEEVLHWLNRVEPSARAMGAVNTVVRRGKRWMGFNTDVTGFLASLEKGEKFRIRGKKVLILGAGGSARAVAYGLAKRGAKVITIANRTKSRADKIVKRFRCFFPKVKFEAASLVPCLPPACRRGKDRAGRGARASGNDTVDIDLVVNATSVGLRQSDPALVQPAVFPKRTLFMDLIYNPAQTRLLRLARRSGHRTMNGAGMLLYQGAEAFRLWTGKAAPVAVMRQEIGKILHGN